MAARKDFSKKMVPDKDSPPGRVLSTKSAQLSDPQKSKSKMRNSTKRQSMLNTRKLAPFKYDMNEIFSTSQVDELKSSAILASIIAKASRQSTKKAKEFVRTFLDAGDITKEEYDKIGKLMDKYSKYR